MSKRLASLVPAPSTLLRWPAVWALLSGQWALTVMVVVSVRHVLDQQIWHGDTQVLPMVTMQVVWLTERTTAVALMGGMACLLVPVCVLGLIMECRQGRGHATAVLAAGTSLMVIALLWGILVLLVASIRWIPSMG